MSYEYSNARLRAMKSRLFQAHTYNELLAYTRVDDLIARLAQSTYADEIQVALARYQGVRVVMEAGRTHLAHTLRTVRSFFDADGARLMSILLARWDLFNLKTILRGHGAGMPPDEILEALVSVGDLDEAALRALVRQTEPMAVADLLKTWNVAYAQAAREALAQLSSSHNWGAFEAALDSVFYTRLLSSLDPERENDQLVREYLVRELDTTNVLIALRLRGEFSARAGRGARGELELTIDRHFLGDGTLSREWLAALLRAARDDDALTRLRASKFGAALSGVETLDMSKVQRALERDLARYGMAFFQRDPLSIATAIGFVAAKSAEVANVRLMAQGIALGIRHEEIEKDLMISEQ
jgi:V/A-type H+/Na+-transporting ATPase subunit C